jgi:hypothetical protein
MALSLLNVPSDIAYSRNPVLYRIHTDRNPSVDINLRIRAEIYLILEGGPEPLVTCYEEPDSDGNCSFNLQELLHSVFDSFPAPFRFTEMIRAIDMHHLRYLIEFSEMYGEPLVVEDVLWLPDRFCVHGGNSDMLPFIHHQQNAWPQFYTAAPSARKFLTRMPANSVVSPQTPHWLTFYITSDQGVDGVINLKIKYTINYSDGTSSTGTITPATTIDLEYDRIISIHAGFNMLSLEAIQPTKTPVSYSLQLVNSADDPLSAARSFLIDNRPYLNERYCLFKNSSGGWDTIRLLGQSEMMPEYEEQLHSMQQYLHIDNRNTENTFFSDSRETIKEKLHTSHHYMTRAHVDWIRDLRLSPICYLSQQLPGNTFFWHPAKCISKKLDMPNSREWLYGIPLEFRYLTDNRSFSPSPPVVP